jgi:hypothetical protein
MFADYLHEYTHWGWVDLDTVTGDMSKMIEDLKNYHIVTYTDGVFRFRNHTLRTLSLQYAPGIFLAGQLTVLSNIDYFRRFFAASFKPENSSESRILIQGEDANLQLDSS